MKNLLLIICLCLFIGRAQAQWTIIDNVNFDGNTYEADVATGGSAYWDDGASSPAGPRNGLINGTWEVANTGLGATQSTPDASNGRFLMFWTDNGYSGSPAPASGNVWSKTYTGLTVGMQYRYSFLYGSLVCPSCAAPTGTALPLLGIRLDGSTVVSLSSTPASWTKATYTFIATATTHTLSIRNKNSSQSGNDFGLDDIKLEEFLLVLPVKLISFNGAKSGDCCDALNWRTADQLNFSHFEIQQSTDALAFNSIGTVNAKDSLAGSSYQFINKDVNGAQNYYRLLMTDIDGHIEYTMVILIKGRTDNQVKVYPNPVTGKVNITGVTVGDIIEITNIAGQIILTSKAATQSQMINMSQLPVGLYAVSITRKLSGDKRNIKIMKQ